MTEQLRTGITTKLPPVTLAGDVEADEVYVIAGHKGNPAAIAKKGGSAVGVGSKARPAAARWKRTNRRSSV